MKHSSFSDVEYKLSGPFGAFLTDTSQICLPLLTTLKAKSDHGSKHLNKISGIIGIIIAHYHKRTVNFVSCPNREELESSKIKSGSVLHLAKFLEAYRI